MAKNKDLMMKNSLGNALVMVALTFAGPSAEAAGPYVYGPQYSLYSPYQGYSTTYPAYSTTYPPYATGYASAYPAMNYQYTIPDNTANDAQFSALRSAAAAAGHVVVPTVSVDGKTPSMAAYQSGFGAFLGWYQLINGFARFIPSDRSDLNTGVTSTEFSNFVNQYNSDVKQIKAALKVKTDGGGGGNEPITNGEGGGLVPGGPSPTVGDTKTDKLDNIIKSLTNLKIQK